MQWFRMYNEIVDNYKVKLLPPDDRWYFVAILSCKSQGVLDCDPELLEEVLQVKLGVTKDQLKAIQSSLLRVKLIDEKYQPIGWDERQFVSDNSSVRSRKLREKSKVKQDATTLQRCKNVSATPPDTETETETESESEQKQNKSIVNQERKIILARVAALGIDMDLWNEYLRTRKRLKASNSPRGLKVLLTEIEKLVKLGEDATELVERSNSNGWKTVYAVGGSQRNSRSALALITDTNW
jgi:hypothetical protein